MPHSELSCADGNPCVTEILKFQQPHRSAVQRGAVANRALESPIVSWLIEKRRDRTLIMEKGDRDSEPRASSDQLCSAIDWVDYKACLLRQCRWIRTGFFAEDRRVGQALLDCVRE